jgi:tRNA dimethylallyltransferase
LRASLVAIVGPTAVGKSEIAIRIAQSLAAELVSADSRLLYRGMNIGTDKPTAIQRSQVPHHLIDVADPQKNWSLAQYKRRADLVIGQIQARDRLPILVGGTGQYVTAVLEGWTPPPAAETEDLRRELEAYAASHGAGSLHARLAAVDPERAAQLDPANIRRVVRALEVYDITGARASTLPGAKPPSYPILRLGLNRPRSALYERIDHRIDRMLESGLVEEVQRLLDQGLTPDDPPMSAIGYRQIAKHVLGAQSLEESVRESRRLSRQLVRRQANWFKADDPQIEWFEANNDPASHMLARIEDWLRAESYLGARERS